MDIYILKVVLPFVPLLNNNTWASSILPSPRQLPALVSQVDSLPWLSTEFLSHNPAPEKQQGWCLHFIWSAWVTVLCLSALLNPTLYPLVFILSVYDYGKDKGGGKQSGLAVNEQVLSQSWNRHLLLLFFFNFMPFKHFFLCPLIPSSTSWVTPGKLFFLASYHLAALKRNKCETSERFNTKGNQGRWQDRMCGVITNTDNSGVNNRQSSELAQQKKDPITQLSDVTDSWAYLDWLDRNLKVMYVRQTLSHGSFKFFKYTIKTGLFLLSLVSTKLQ